MKYKQKGGLLLPYKDQEKSNAVFNEFIQNAEKIEMISRGSYGLTFKVSLPKIIPPEFVSKDYKQISPDANFGEPVDCILVKLAFILDTAREMEKFLQNNPDRNPNRINRSSFTKNFELLYKDTDIEIFTSDPSDFQNEINIQTDIYLKTIEYLQPLCPGIVYANILDTSLGVILLNQFEEKHQEELDLIIDMINVLKSNKNISLGVIGMQFVNNSKTLHQSIIKATNLQDKIMLRNISRYALLELAIKTGYNHNDFHIGNIMIEDNDKYFYQVDERDAYVDGLKQRAVIIDFGRATKIPPEIMALIKESVEKGLYNKALKYLCNPKTGNEFVTDKQYKSFYGWVCHDYNINSLNEGEFNAESVQSLYKLRESAIDANIGVMEQLHKENPTKYPLLPVSNAFKNELYEGMLGGKRRKTKRKMHRKHKTRKNRKTTRKN